MLAVGENNEEETSEAQQGGTGRRRRKKSIVWEHFTIETVSAGCRRACCKQCKQSFAYSTGSKVAGTSHLKRHLTRGSCQINHDPANQLTPYTRSPRHLRRHHRPISSPPPPSPPPFDPDHTRHELTRFLIMHDHPLHTVQQPAFLSFLHSLQPRFSVPDLPSVQNDCLSAYLREKPAVLRLLSSRPGRLSLSLYLSFSPNSISYILVSAHFLDPDWNPPSRWLLNVVPASDFCHAVSLSSSYWSLQNRLFSITTNRNLPPGEAAPLRSLLSVTNPLLFGGQLLLSDCLSSTLTEIALHVLGLGTRHVVEKVRECVRHVTTTESEEARFIALRNQLQVPSDKILRLDDQRWWDTTFHMLEAAYDLKEVFSCMELPEETTMEEWKVVAAACARLRLLHATAELLRSPNLTPNLIFHEIWKLKAELAGFSDRIDLYWDASYLILAAAVVMDPRFKMKLVEFSFSKIYGDGAGERVRVVEEGIHELFAEYAGEAAADGGCGVAAAEGGRMSDFEEYIMETSRQNVKSELEQYLEEQLLPRVTELDVMAWWRVNTLRYPTLARVAGDVLSVAVSTVPTEEVFDTRRPREVEADRGSLRPEIAEAVLCCKDWMHHVSNPVPTAIVKVEYSNID